MNNKVVRLIVLRICKFQWYRDSVDNTVEENSSVFSNALVSVSKGMRAVKLCTNKILQFVTGGAG